VELLILLAGKISLNSIKSGFKGIGFSSVLFSSNSFSVIAIANCSSQFVNEFINNIQKMMNKFLIRNNVLSNFNHLFSKSSETFKFNNSL